MNPPYSAVILVADDAAQNRMLAEAHLTSAGYRVVLAENGRRALELFETTAPDLVLLDILMPELDGIATCRALRALPGGADVPVLFLTALGDVTTYRDALESGGDDFLVKPSSRTELIMRVRSLLRIRRMSVEQRAHLEVIAGQRDELLRLQRQQQLLTALLVHDLKNPLSSIIANLDFVHGCKMSCAECLEAVEDGRESAESLLRMIMTLLDIGRAEDGSLTLRESTFAPAPVLESIQTEQRRRLASSAIELDLEVETGRIRADEDLFRRLVENLLDNAIKFTPSRARIQVACHLSSTDGVRLTVTDGGRGVALADRERIFDKYQRLDGHAGAGRTSRGLGLAFCRMAATAHGGEIHVEDGPEGGARFVVTLPAERVHHG